MFRSVKGDRPNRNKFDLSHERKLSCNMGDLVPMYLQEIVPGDSFRVNSEIFMRLAPMLAPIMHRVDVYTHYFFVPNRIIWNEWEDFVTGGEDGLQVPVPPRAVYNSVKSAVERVDTSMKGSLADYFGLPPVAAAIPYSPKIVMLAFRAYQEIYNEYYRDQNLTDKVNFVKTSGEIISGDELDLLVKLRKRCWEKDYFTSALPWAQRGGSVSVEAGVNYAWPSTAEHSGGGAPTDANLTTVSGDVAGGAGGLVTIKNIDDVSIDINDLRRSSALQRWLELAARGGSRYIEQIKSLFGVQSSDSRLQRPEYLGGGKQNVIISEVLQTSATEVGSPQGNQSGHGVSVGSSNTFSKSFEEHGFVIGIMSVLPRTAYQQGINKMWSRMDKFDYFYPQFAHLGEQEVKVQELYYNNNPEYEDTFGYQSRYAEYKHASSIVSGDFRDTLNYWHMGRIFDASPDLNEAFVESNPTHRIFANTTVTDHKLWVQIYNRVDALRPMPYFGTPRL